MPVDHWANDFVGWAVDRAITSGVRATEFGGPRTREQMITFLYRAKGSPAGGSLGSDVYEDIPGDRSQWANLPIGWVFDQGVSGGIAAGIFGFGTDVSREEIVLFLCRVLAPDTCPPSQDPLPSSVVPTSTSTGPQPQGQASDPPEGAYLHRADGFSCWETDPLGPLEIECDTDRYVPSEGQYTKLTVGNNYLCAIEYTGKNILDNTTGQSVSWPGPIKGWGTPPAYTPAFPDDEEVDIGGHYLPDGGFIDIAAGVFEMCAITDENQPRYQPSGTLLCWGHDGGGYPLNAIQGEYNRPAVGVAVGILHACVLWESEFAGSVECWGNGSYGQLEPQYGAFLDVHSWWISNRTCVLTAYPPQEWQCWGRDEKPGGIIEPVP